MTYSKPEITLLGDAARVIQGMKIGDPFESVERPTELQLVAAYGLDE